MISDGHTVTVHVSYRPPDEGVTFDCQHCDWNLFLPVSAEEGTEAIWQAAIHSLGMVPA